MKSVFGWKPVWHISDALEKVAEWTMAYLNGEDVNAVMNKQIDDYQEKFNVK